MNELINGIGGYDSYMFATLSIGCYVIGGVITGFWKWFFPVPSFGAILILSFFVYAVDKLIPSGNIIIDGVAPTIPILFMVASLLTIYYIGWGKKKGNNETQKIDTFSDSVRSGKEETNG